MTVLAIPGSCGNALTSKTLTSSLAAVKLSEYLVARGESESEFARRAGLTQRTVNRVCSGQGCNAATARDIIKASHSKPTPMGGTVSLDDLISEDEGAAA